MINDLDSPGFELWKYVDDSTVSEPSQQHPDRCRYLCLACCLGQIPVKRKVCKEMRICFSTNRTHDLNSIVINNDKQVDALSHAKILGVNSMEFEYCGSG